MNLVEVFLRQGIVGIVCPVAFIALMVTGIIAGILKTKAVGHTFFAGAWLAAGVFTVFVSRNMMSLANMEQKGAAAMSMFATNQATITFFLQPALGFSMVAVLVLAAAKFERRHILAEGLAVVALLFLSISVQWYMKSMFQMFSQ